MSNVQSARPLDHVAGLSRLRWLLGAVVVAVAIAAIYLGLTPDGTATQATGDFAILAAAVIATFSCAAAVRRRPHEARAWTMLTGAMVLWTAGQALWTYYGLARDGRHPFPSWADAGFLGYAVPAAVALFSFPRPKVSRTALLRTVLDAAVISGAVLFVSWDTVLGPLWMSPNHGELGRLTSLGYPIVDVVITSLVLSLAMRRAPGERLPWLFLGGGLLTLTCTDSIYAKLTSDGVTGVTGSPLAAGWIAAFLLIALAPLAPHGDAGTRVARRGHNLALELLPYVPVVGAVGVSFVLSGQGRSSFVLFNGVIVLVLVVVRQVLIVFENVTLTRELEQKVALRTAQLEGLAAIVNSSADAIVGTSPDGTITSWNPGAERVYGYASDEVMGKKTGFLVPAELHGTEEAVLDAVRETGTARTFETDRLRKDGSTVPVSLTVSPIHGELGLRGIASIGQDITERRAAEADLSNAREAALESSRLKSEFLATMSHEIRTPMNGVVGLTTLLLDTSLDPTQRQYAEGVRGAGDALLALINDILDFSKLEAGKVELDPTTFDPRALVDEVAGLLATAAQAKGLELIAYCRPEVPAHLMGDAGRIRQVLLNLAANAVKFTDSGEVTLRVQLADPRQVNSLVRFDVRDTGIGIDPVHHERLFDAFSQADASTTRKYGGTGLGLAISQRLTVAMGGEIGLTSAVGSGSTFWFTLPLATATPLDERPAVSTPNPLTGLRVLVVDDNATNRLVLESQLTAWRMRPEVASDAPGALTRCREAAGSGAPFDVVVLDMCMPGMDGLELAQALTDDAALPTPAMIMLTSTADVSRADMSAAGIREWLTKPVRSSEFYDRLMRLTAAAQPAAAAGPALPDHHTGPSRGRVLVVEDNEVNQLVAREMVSKLGFQVDVVGDGAQAVAATEAHSYSAILMDCHMPVMDGFMATKTIRAREEGHLPIIAMTAGALDEDRQRCLAAGMDDYLAKPVDYAALDEKLSRWTVAPAPEKPPAPALDRARLEILRSLGPADGHGLLPAAAEAFRSDVPGTLATLRQALSSGQDEPLAQAAHKLMGAAANIGATTAAALCGDLQNVSTAHHGMEILVTLEAELARVDEELRLVLEVAP